MVVGVAAAVLRTSDGKLPAASIVVVRVAAVAVVVPEGGPREGATGGAHAIRGPVIAYIISVAAPGIATVEAITGAAVAVGRPVRVGRRPPCHIARRLTSSGEAIVPILLLLLLLLLLLPVLLLVLLLLLLLQLSLRGRRMLVVRPNWVHGFRHGCSLAGERRAVLLLLWLLLLLLLLLLPAVR